VIFIFFHIFGYFVEIENGWTAYGKIKFSASKIGLR